MLACGLYGLIWRRDGGAVWCRCVSDTVKAEWVTWCELSRARRTPSLPMRSSSRLGKVVGEGARLVGDDAPPAGVGTVRIGPYRVGTASCVFDMTDAAVAARFDDRLRDLRVGGSATAGNEPPTVFLVARRGGAPATHPWGVWRDGEPCETTVTEDYLMPYLLWEITRLLLERSTPFIPVHAAAVSRNGRAIVLAGVSHVGKSTLAGWLTVHGWSFLTDEVALLERRAERIVWVHPFWRPIGVRRPGPLDALMRAAPGGDEQLVPASELGQLGGPVPVAALVFPSRDAGVERTPQRHHPAAVVRELASHLPRLGLAGRSGFRDIVGIASTVPAFQLGVASLPEAAATLEALIADLEPG